jgi:hypothetical protein
MGIFRGSAYTADADNDIDLISLSVDRRKILAKMKSWNGKWQLSEDPAKLIQNT